jgi:hypothetical protein
VSPIRPATRIGTYPRDGRTLRLIANTESRIIPSQKSGIASPMLEKVVMMRSAHPPCLTAARMPSGTPMRIVSTRAPSASDRVTGKRCRIDCMTVSWSKNDVPRSPCTALPSQMPYCCTNGWSRCSSSRAWAMPSGVAFCPPAITRAGSPGRSCDSEKTMNETMMSSGISASTRRAMYAPIVRLR